MDPLEHPLDWWAYGGYPAVMRELNCTEPAARRKVRLKIADYYHRTGNPLWKSIGHAGYERLRQSILSGTALANDLQ
jgi:hypothetical protein